MRLRSFRTFLVFCTLLLFIIWFTLWNFQEQRTAYSFKVNIPKAYSLHFTDAELWEYVESGNDYPIAEFDRRKLPIPNDDTFLTISLQKDNKLKINMQEFGNLEDTTPLTAKLTEVFHEREQNGIFYPNSNKIVKAVIVRAPRSANYDDVIKVIDAVKISGADPIVLQIDDLPQ